MTQPPQPPDPDIQALVKKVNTDDPAPQDIQALRLALAANREVWLQASDLSAKARRLALGNFDRATQEAILLRLEGLEESLGQQRSAGIRALLVEQIGTCWVHLTLVQNIYGLALKKSPDPSLIRLLDRWLTNAQKRYLAAVQAFDRALSW